MDTFVFFLVVVAAVGVGLYLKVSPFKTLVDAAVAAVVDAAKKVKG